MFFQLFAATSDPFLEVVLMVQKQSGELVDKYVQYI